MSKQRKVAECVFKRGFITEKVDPLVDEMWKASFGGKTPFGDLRNMFRRAHCRVLNPYGDSENCPYDEEDCARAFYATVRATCRAMDRMGELDRPVGYFITVARSFAAKRADDAVASRARAARMRGTDVHLDPTPPTPQPGPQDRGLGQAAARGDRQGSPGRAALAGGERPPDSPAPDRSDASVPGSGHGPVSLGDLLGSVASRPRQGRPEDRPEGPRR